MKHYDHVLVRFIANVYGLDADKCKQKPETIPFAIYHFVIHTMKYKISKDIKHVENEYMEVLVSNRPKSLPLCVLFSYHCVSLLIVSF